MSQLPPTAALIAAMAKHLPPSGAALRLLDIGAGAGGVLNDLRSDLRIHPLDADVRAWEIAPDSADAAAVFAQPLSPALLDAVLLALRQGGRLIAVLPGEQPDASWVTKLEKHGYTRILVEAALPHLAVGVLVRGEKPHTTADTLARIRVASSQDDRLTDLARYPGRSLYLLVRQTPSKPAWALREGERIAWDAVTVPVGERGALLAFSSLAKAVAFMQPAVLRGQIRDISKVAKYRVEVVRGWETPVLLNPDEDILSRAGYALSPVDPALAEAPDE